MQQFNALYTIKFSAIVCIVCSLLVSSAAVGLQGLQKRNAVLDKRKNVLMAIGEVKPGESISAEEVEKKFEHIEPLVIDLNTGEETDIDPTTFDQQKAMKDPETSKKAPQNPAQVRRIPNHGLVYKVMDGDKVDMLVLPIEGKGLWSTLYGFLALDADTTTIEGITYYQHGETPGLGGEVDNPKWKSLWPGRQAYGDNWEPQIQVIKGQAGPPEQTPHKVDGLSGATITSRGVTHMLRFWLGENGYGPYLEKFRKEHGVA